MKAAQQAAKRAEAMAMQAQDMAQKERHRIQQVEDSRTASYRERFLAKQEREREKGREAREERETQRRLAFSKSFVEKSMSPTRVAKLAKKAATARKKLFAKVQHLVAKAQGGA